MLLRRFCMLMKLTLNLAGVPIALRLNHAEYEPIFRPFVCNEAPSAEVSIAPDTLRECRKHSPESPEEAYAEYMELCPLVCDALLPHDRAIFHSVAFLWQGRAWLLAGLSGAGKTTHYALWKLLYGEELRMLNGDKPILDFSGENVQVCPSPWMGKERLRSMHSAPLGGIVFLRQGQQNRMTRLSATDAIERLFLQFLFTRSTPEQVHSVCRLEERLLHEIPIWQLENRGDEDAARLCHDTLAKELSIL